MIRTTQFPEGFKCQLSMRVVETVMEQEPVQEPTRRELWGFLGALAFLAGMVFLAGWKFIEIVLFIKAWWGNL